MEYKVGDRVRIKSIDWYNENKDLNGNVNCDNINFTPYMVIYCGNILTVCNINEDFSYYHMEGNQYAFTDEMIEGLAKEETKPRYEDEVNGEYYSTPKYLVRPSGYQFVDENGNVINATKIVLEKKKKEYPKTYEECCKILNLPVRDLDILDNMLDTTEIVYNKNLDRLLNSFRKLLICRDAYWKIAREEMGLGKPWEPDFVRGKNNYTITREGNEWCFTATVAVNCILAFPTREMRDAFYKNFKELIEQCKELL